MEFTDCFILSTIYRRLLRILFSFYGVIENEAVSTIGFSSIFAFLRKRLAPVDFLLA